MVTHGSALNRWAPTPGCVKSQGWQCQATRPVTEVPALDFQEYSPQLDARRMSGDSRATAKRYPAITMRTRVANYEECRTFLGLVMGRGREATGRMGARRATPLSRAGPLYRNEIKLSEPMGVKKASGPDSKAVIRVESL